MLKLVEAAKFRKDVRAVQCGSACAPRRATPLALLVLPAGRWLESRCSAGKLLFGWRDPGNSSETCRKDLERRDDLVSFVLEPGEPMLARSRR